MAAKTGAAIRRGQVGEPTYILREILLICFVYQLVAMMKKKMSNENAGHKKKYKQKAFVINYVLVCCKKELVVGFIQDH